MPAETKIKKEDRSQKGVRGAAAFIIVVLGGGIGVFTVHQRIEQIYISIDNSKLSRLRLLNLSPTDTRSAQRQFM